MSIRLSGIYKNYGQSKVLQNINFEVKKGEITAFLGPNGAGKSTCIKIITGWLNADKGRVQVCGYDISSSPIEAKRRMGYLPENNPLYPEMYVREYLEYVGGIYKMPQPFSINELAEQVRITNVLNKTIGTLSKGYRQRVGLAQALIHHPEMLILDEPFTGLDPNQQEEIQQLIKELGKDKAILFSSHTLSDVISLAQRTVIIHKGGIVADSILSELTKEESLDEIFKRVTHESNS